MTSLAAFQAAFVEAVLAAEVPSRSSYTAQPGFAVYRNTVMSGCIDALRANYPSVHAQLGDEPFRAAARAHACEAPPRHGVLAAYGEGFARWLDDRADDELRRAAPLARLDRCWTESHGAADAPSLDPADLASLAPARFAAGRLVPHPAARWITFDTLPAFTAWRRCREPLAAGVGLAPPLDHVMSPGHDIAPSRGESALLTRPSGTVTWRVIDAGAAAFLSLCRDGRPVASALDAVADAGLDADFASWLPDLMHARAFTRFDLVDGDRR